MMSVPFHRLAEIELVSIHVLMTIHAVPLLNALSTVIGQFASVLLVSLVIHIASVFLVRLITFSIS